MKVQKAEVEKIWSFSFRGKRFPLSKEKVYIENRWRRKCVRRGIFRTVEVRVAGRFVPFNPYFVCNTAIGSLCDLYGVTLPKNSAVCGRTRTVNVNTFSTTLKNEISEGW